MKKITGYYDSVFKTEKDIQYQVSGSFTTMPGDSEDLLPGTNLIYFEFWIIELTGDGFKPIPRHRSGYIGFNEDQWQAGNVMNQRFILSTSPFLNWLKDVVVTKYLSLTTSEKVPFAGDI